MGVHAYMAPSVGYVTQMVFWMSLLGCLEAPTKATLVVWAVSQCKHEFADVFCLHNCLCWGLFVEMRTDYELRLHFVFDMLQKRGF